MESNLEDKIAKIIFDILDKRVSIDKIKDSNFLELLDSISFVELIVRLEEEFEIQIDDEFLLMDKLSNLEAVVAMVKPKI